jgi:hypothetical protein
MKINEKGFVIVMASGLSLVICGALWWLMGFELWIDQIEKLRTTCRSEGMKLQERLGLSMAELLQLNIPIKSLAAQKATLRVQQAAALIRYDVIALAVLEKKIRAVTMKQKKIHTQQKIIVETMSRTWSEGVMWVKHKIRNSSLVTQTGIMGGGNVQIFEAKTNSEPQALVEKPMPDESPPLFFKHTNFQEKQTIAFQWRFETNLNLKGDKQWLRPKFRRLDSCAVSLQGSTWRGIVVRDRYYSSSWL